MSIPFRPPVLLAVLSSLATGAAPSATFPVVDTAQVRCYDTSVSIPCPAAGQPFHGQDAQFAGHAAAYAVSADGLTVTDTTTGLTWQRSPDTNGDGSLTAADKLTFAQAQGRPAALNAARFGGYADWRLPTIKELYSLIDFRGTDPSGLSGYDTSGLTPFIDTAYFRFAYGAAPERVIDSQYASSTLYVGPVASGSAKLFGVNFADGRIKGYDLSMPDGSTKTFFVQCVRGNPSYGVNAFVDDGDGTVTDSASGLMWTRADSGSAMTWQEALAFADAKNASGFLGHSDWRLPNAKELQSLLAYSRSPDTTSSAAIDPVFSATAITNEGGQADFPWYWASTTHATHNGMGASGVYVCFGRCGGWQKTPPSASCYTWTDVHGAGAQRGDPKTPAGRVLTGTACNGGTAWGLGPQGDVQRGANFVRLVRDSGTSTTGSTATRFLPIVLDVTGRARYTSELTLANRGTSIATVELAYTPAPAFGGAGAGTVTLPLAAGHQVVVDDALAFLRTGDLAIPAGNQGGSLRATFSGLSSPETTFAGVRVTAPSENGRSGVSYVAPRVEDLPTGTSWLFGLRATADDRTNLALANASATSTLTLRVTLVNGNGTLAEVRLPDVTLAPGAWTQLDDVLSGTGIGQGWAKVSVVSGTGPYAAYAVFNDAGTNDGSFVPFEVDPVEAEARLVPVVVETGPYATELVLTNPSASSRDVSLTYVESLSPSKGAGGTTVVTLGAGEQRIVADLFGELRGRLPGTIGPKGYAGYAGALQVTFLSGTTTAAGFAGARVASPAKTVDGSYGLFAPGLAASATATGEAWVFGLRQDGAVRTNLAVSAAANEGPMTFAVEVHDGETGALAGTTDAFTLAPGGWKQLSGLLSSFGVAQGYARVAVRSGSGRFAAYAVVNDGPAPGSPSGTDDGSYLPFSNR
ncbi:MAG: DUF1566 domain-containing protein [Thermoanaerobaculia bacterium]